MVLFNSYFYLTYLTADRKWSLTVIELVYIGKLTGLSLVTSEQVYTYSLRW